MREKNVICLHLFVAVLMWMCSRQTAQAQVVYAVAKISSAPEFYLIKIDLATCEVCPIRTEIITNSSLNFMILPDGSVLHFVGIDGITRVEPPPGSNVLWTGFQGTDILDGIVAPNGTIYLAGYSSGLYTFDPGTNAITFVGPWPAGGGCNSMYILNGELHAIWHPYTGGTTYDITINVNNPANSTFNNPNPPYLSYVDPLEWNGVEGALSVNTTGAGSLEFFNPDDGSITTLCSFSPPIDIVNTNTAPPGVPEFDCIDPCTTTNAGVFPSSGPFTGCNIIYYPATINYDLNPSEVINYILYSDPANPLGSILAQTTGSYVFFNPATMQTGVDYYIAAIAGNASGGTVVLTDPCLDISDPVTVRFADRPAVTFSGPLLEICPGGCTTLTTNFTGTPPFTLNGEVRSGTSVLATFTGSSATNTGTVEVCIPPGVPPGPIQVVATSLTDANCNCN